MSSNVKKEMNLSCIAGPEGAGDKKIVLPLELQLQSIQLFIDDKNKEKPFKGIEENIRNSEQIFVRILDKAFNIAEVGHDLHQKVEQLEESANYFFGDKDKRMYFGPILQVINASTYGRVKANKIVFFAESPMNSDDRFEPKRANQVGVTVGAGNDKNSGENAILLVSKNGSVFVRAGGYLIFDCPIVLIKSTGDYLTINTGADYNRVKLKNGFHVILYIDFKGVSLPVLIIRPGKGVQKITPSDLFESSDPTNRITVDKELSDKDLIVERIVINDDSDDKYVPKYIFDWIKSKGYVIERGGEGEGALGIGPSSVVRRGTRVTDNKLIAAKIIVCETSELKERKRKPPPELYIAKKVNYKYVIKASHILCIIAELPQKLDRMSSVVIMELGSANNLRKIVETDGKFSEEKARETLRQVMAAIAYLHDCSIAHRHIRLNNCVVFDNNVIKLCDFSRALDTSPNARPNTGEPPELALKYMPPEFMDSENTDPFKMDIWMSGCLLYSLLTANFSPFGSLSMADKNDNSPKFQDFRRNQTTEVEAIIKSIPALSDVTIDLLAKLWSIDPKQRIAAKPALTHPCIK